MEKKKLFIKVYLIAVSAFVILIAVGAILLSSYLSAFEKTRPNYIAEEIFNKYFVTGDYKGAVALSSAKESHFENDELIGDSLKKKFSGKQLVIYENDSQDGIANYSIAAVESSEEIPPDPSVSGAAANVPSTVIKSTKIANITVKKTEEKKAWGFFAYELSDISFCQLGDVNVKIKAPSDSVVSVNGVAVSDEYTASTEESSYNAHLPKDAKRLDYKNIEIKGLFSDPVVTAKSADGASQKVSRSDSDGSYTVELNYSEELKEKLADFVLAGEKKEAERMVNKATLASLAPYFDTSSDYYKYVSTSSVTFGTSFNSYSFEEEKCENFYAFDDNTICCHTSFKMRFKKTGKSDFVDQINKIVFLKKIDGAYRIYDSVSSSEK